MKNLKLIVALSLFLLFGKFLYANSGPMEYFSGGSLKPMTGEHKSIQMKSELVEIYLYEGYYRVIATFYFENFGDSTTVIMGFPENFNTDIPVKYVEIQDSISGFNSVKCFVDGEEVEIKRYSLDRIFSGSTDYFNTFQTYWIKKVKFEKNQKRKVVVDYTVNNDYSFGKMEYNFTGGNWYKNVEHSKLVIQPMGIFDPPMPYPKGVEFKNGKYVFEKFNWEADYAFEWAGYVKSKFRSILTKPGIYDVYRGDINGYTYLSFYLFKDYQQNILYVSPINFINPPYRFQDIHHSVYQYAEFYPDNILRIDRKGYSNGEFHQIVDFIDLNKTFKPEFTFTYYKYFDHDNLHLFKKNIGNIDYYFIMQLKTPYYIRYTHPKPEHDSIRLIFNREEFVTNSYRGVENNNENIFYYLDSNASSLKNKASEYYSFFEKLFAPGEYLDNLEAYVLQMIFLNKEEEAWYFFEDNFPYFCDKEKSKERILEEKQNIFKLKTDI